MSKVPRFLLLFLLAVDFVVLFLACVFIPVARACLLFCLMNGVILTVSTVRVSELRPSRRAACPACGHKALFTLRLPGCHVVCLHCNKQLTRRESAGRWLGYAPPAADDSTLGQLLLGKGRRNGVEPVKAATPRAPVGAGPMHDQWLDA
jgi:DNA-directed RNA polymerase subunit RPC12/RpoP